MDVDKKIDAHFSKFPKRNYEKGQILLFADENPTNIFYIAEGKVRKYDVSYRGEEVIVNIFKPPSFFPMSWATNRSPNKFFYKAETDSILHIVPVEEALKFLKANPDVMLDLLGRIYRGMDGLLGRMVHLMSGTACSRLIYELIVESRRFGEKQKNGSYKLAVSEIDLAARTGLSRETVNREIHKIKAEGLVEIKDKAISVKDLDSLGEKLGMEL